MEVDEYTPKGKAGKARKMNNPQGEMNNPQITQITPIQKASSETFRGQTYPAVRTSADSKRRFLFSLTFICAICG